jgi:hypothetical protein
MAEVGVIFGMHSVSTSSVQGITRKASIFDDPSRNDSLITYSTTPKLWFIDRG